MTQYERMDTLYRKSQDALRLATEIAEITHSEQDVKMVEMWSSNVAVWKNRRDSLTIEQAQQTVT